MMFQGMTVSAGCGREIGTIMSYAEVMFPQLENDLSTSMQRAEDEVKAHESQMQQSNLSDSRRATLVSEHQLHLQRGLNKISQLQSAISELRKAVWPPTRATLPLEPYHVSIKSAVDSYQSEKLDQMTFSTESLPQVDQKVEAFIRGLGNLQQLLDIRERDSIVHSIATLVAQSKSVVLLGSFITLGRVKVPEALKARKFTPIDKWITQDPSKTYVLTEEILGGVFLGIGTLPFEFMLAGDTKMTLSNVNVVCLGAFPRQIGDGQLWSLYSSWKENLIENPTSGCPIMFKAVPLTQVLQKDENLSNQ